MAQFLPPAPTGVPPGHAFWNDWYEKLRSLVNNTVNIAWSAITGTPTTLAGYGITDAGTVQTVSVVSANGVSGSVATPTTTPAITLALGAITPSSVAATGTVTGSNLSGINTGNQTITLTGGVTGSGTGSFAATVVTNANLTGPITSVGNATAVASQTGTGSTFVMNTSPTLVTPVLGVATATSLQSPIGNVTPNTGVFSTLRAANDESTRLQADTVNGGGARLWVRRAESIGGTAGTAGVGLDCLNTAEGGLVPLYVRASNTTISGATTVTGNLTVPGGASVIFTSTALTNGAGAAAGTITNAPVAGNPTKWIGINDNGTVRYIPAW